MTITIRKPFIDENREFLAIAELDRNSWGDNRHSTYIPDGEHVWRIWVEHGIVFVAVVEENIIGFVLAFPSNLSNSLYILHKLLVKKEFRRKGIGSMLFRAICDELDKRETNCFLTTDVNNYAMQSLCKKFGFSHSQYYEGFYRSEENRLILTRQCGHLPIYICP